MAGILGLKDTEIIILAYIRECTKEDTDSIELQQIVDQIDTNRLIVIGSLLDLKINNYIEQVLDSNEQDVFWNHSKARYKISEVYKMEIQQFLKYDLKNNTVIIDGEYIWYAVYGTGILQEKFMHYIQGGICRFNHTEYEGCKDTSLPLGNRPIIIPYRSYIGGSSPLWQYKGTIFLDSKQKGITKGRMYLIKLSQYQEIRSQIGRGKERYNEELELGEYLGVPIKVVTNKINRIPSEASIKYKHVIEQGLIETYGIENLKENKVYLDSLFDYQVKLNLSKEYIEDGWKKEIREIIKEMHKKEVTGERGTNNNINTQEKIDNNPNKIITTTTLIKHNSMVIAKRLLKAKGRCERCGKQSPAYKIGGDIEFLEVYYISALENGGKDELDNTIALCPNCKKEVEMGIRL